MIREISCKSAQCIHNFAGRCARDGVQVEEYLGEYGNIPYCNSFATARCMDALKKYGGPYVIGQGAGHFQTEFATASMNIPIESAALCRAACTTGIFAAMPRHSA